MTTKAEKEMLAFLASKDNLPHVLEILRRGDEIERRILTMFWTDLKHCVQEDPIFPIMSDGQMKLELQTDEDPWEIELWYHDPRIDDPDGESLFYSIFFFLDDDAAELSYGVQWQNYLKDVPRKLTKLSCVEDLMENLDEMEFEKPKPNCSLAGHRSIDVGNKYDFLTRIATGDAESVLQDVSTNFCALVKGTRDLVIQANKEIIAATSK